MTLQEFRKALSTEEGRARLGIDLTSDQAAAVLADDGLLDAWFKYASTANLAGATSDGQLLAISSPKMITLQPRERRVPVGSLAGEPGAALKAIEVAPDSAEAMSANAPFNPRVYPQPDTLVPADCVWAFTPPPKVHRSVPRGGVPQIFVALGELRGRTLDEIVHYAGAPMASNTGTRIRVWGKTSLFSGIYQIALQFDAYDIVGRLVSETRA